MKQRSDGVTIIAIYQFLVGFLSLLGICGLLSIPLIVGASTAAARAEGGPLATAIVSTVMVVLSAWLFLVGLANVIFGWGLWQQREWGRIGSLVLAFFRLLSFPIGTVIGALIIWYLLREDVKPQFRPESEAPEPAAPQLPAGPSEAGEPAPEAAEQPQPSEPAEESQPPEPPEESAG
jgi:hypothetical protein